MKWALLPIFWIACAVAGYLYTQPRGVPWDVFLAVAPAFLLEATLFLSVGMEQWRARLDRLPRAAVAALLTLAAVAPYVLASVPFGTLSWTHFGTLAGLAALLAFWYVLLPHNPFTDIGLLVVAAAVVLSKIFRDIYVRPDEHLALEALGTAMWIRTGLFAILSVRRVKGVGFGFWPTLREWKIGALHFVAFLPVAAALGWWINFTRPRWPAAGWEILLPLTFFGVLWVLALGEELFFRGLLQQWLVAWLKSDWGGLVAASLIFGALHVFWGTFPNWRFAALASLAGVFYGSAFRQGKGIRASMVTHALTVTTWKIFFTS
ncbi:MAG: CPBP family intramembrane glutamic endopeptidase [Acidobacteriota bacterium]